MVPITPKLAWAPAHEYSRGVAERIAAMNPDRYVTSAALASRLGKLFIDYLRTGRGTTAVGTYSPRARTGFPIAAPVTWPDIEHGIKPDAYSIYTAPKRHAVGRPRKPH